jgi:nucleotide-binding universal stress UspA family protein
MLNATPNDRSGDGAGVILVAVDGSATSMHAEAWATHLAHARGSQLLYLFVQTHSAYAQAALLTGAEIPSDFGAAEQAKHILDEVRADAEACHVHGEFLVRSGDPATEIERVADEFKVDAVVIGASMQARHRLIGSVARRLVHAGRWPVTVVP